MNNEVPSKAEVLGDLVEADAIRKRYKGVGLADLSGVEEAINKGIEESQPPEPEMEVNENDETEGADGLGMGDGESIPAREDIDDAVEAVERIKTASEEGVFTPESSDVSLEEVEEEDCEPCDLAEKAKIENVCKLIPDEEKREGCLKAVEEGRAGGFERGDLVEAVADEVGRDTFRDAVRSLIMNIAGALPSAEEMDEQLQEGGEEDGEQGAPDYSQTQ